MKHVFKSSLSALALITATALPVHADLTAPQVRDALIGYLESTGYQVSTSSEDFANGRLVISDLNMTIVIPDEDVSIGIGMPELELVENDDGTVNIFVPDVAPVTVEASEDGKVMATALLEVRTENQNIRLSGEPGNTQVSFRLDSSETKLISLDVEGENIPINFAYSTGLWNGDISFETLADGLISIDAVSLMEDFVVKGNVAEPDGDFAMSISADVENLTSNAKYTVNPDLIALMQDPEAIESMENPMVLIDGLALDGQVDLGKATFDLTLREGGDTTVVAAGFDSTSLGFVFSKDEIGYLVRYGGVDVDVTSTDMPLPRVQFNFDDLTVDFNIPLSQGDGPRDFHVRTALKELEMTEGLWSIFDPTQQLPRDPATFVADISGKLLVLIDLLDPENFESLVSMDGPPMLPVSADLNELLVSAAGAMLTGEGSVSVDFTNPNMIAGFPAPEGKFTISLKGGFGLMDKLASMGLIPEDASMGVRAMLGAFSKPIGEDHLESVIELGADGSIKANGQRIQ